MADNSNFCLLIPQIPSGLLDTIRDLFENYAGTSSYYEQSDDPPYLSYGAGDVSLGSVDKLHADLQALIERTGQDFAYGINDEPAYEWRGSIIIHVPGLPDFSGDCDANGTPVLDADMILAAVDEAIDLAGLRIRVAQLTGTEHLKALRTLALRTLTE